MRNLALTVARRAAAAASSLRASAPGALRVAEATLPRSSSLGVAGFSAAAVSDAPVSSHRSVATVGGLFAASAAFAATANLAVAPPAEAKEAVPMVRTPRYISTTRGSQASTSSPAFADERSRR